MQANFFHKIALFIGEIPFHHQLAGKVIVAAETFRFATMAILFVSGSHG
jgi:hypothetical protein